MAIITQSRILPGAAQKATLSLENGNTYLSDSPSSAPSGIQTTTGWRSLQKGVDDEYESLTGEELNRSIRTEYQTRYDNGHNFSTYKEYSDPSSTYTMSVNVSKTGRRTYTGPLKLNNLSAAPYPTITPPSIDKINADGRELISRTIPTAPEFGLAQFLGELREQLPSLVGFHTFRNGLSSRGFGNEYLNYQFGITPLISDVRNLSRAIASFSYRVRQLEQGSGIAIRKKAKLQESHSVEEVSGALVGATLPFFGGYSQEADYFTSYRVARITDTRSSYTRFSGAYSYHLAETHGFLNKLTHYEALANQLLGTRITPEVIWELTPWSWLIDWFTDAGTFIRNLTYLSADSLVLKYGYVMHHTKCIRTFEVLDPVLVNYGYGLSNAPHRIATFATVESKTRTRATPYGFGVDVDAFSPRRWAILGALGLTKSATSLRVN